MVAKIGHHGRKTDGNTTRSVRESWLEDEILMRIERLFACLLNC